MLLWLDHHDIVYRDAAWLDRGPVDTEAALPVARDGPQNRRVALGRCRIDGDDDAPTVSLVDAHAHAADL